MCRNSSSFLATSSTCWNCVITYLVSFVVARRLCIYTWMWRRSDVKTRADVIQPLMRFAVPCKITRVRTKKMRLRFGLYNAVWRGHLITRPIYWQFDTEWNSFLLLYQCDLVYIYRESSLYTRVKKCRRRGNHWRNWVFHFLLRVLLTGSSREALNNAHLITYRYIYTEFI